MRTGIILYRLRLSLLEVPDRPPKTLARFAREDPELGGGLLGAAGVTRQYGSTPLEFVFLCELTSAAVLVVLLCGNCAILTSQVSYVHWKYDLGSANLGCCGLTIGSRSRADTEDTVAAGLG